jgi:2-(1,2-epoxy-1,2-dihydrophenyl)acetyl-CoA isomerase
MTVYQTLLYNVDQNVALIRLNRPERRNALTRELLSELTFALDAAGSDDGVRAVVLTGEGKTFCSGQDLSAFTAAPTPDDIRAAIAETYKPAILRLCTLPKPVIAAVNGAAAGAGASLALACDLRVLADDASLVQAFVNIGLVPDAGSSWFLTRLVGYSRAFEIAISGERIPAPRCLELGLANRIAPAASLLDSALEWARQLAQRPTYAIGLTKQAMIAATEHSLAGTMDLEADLQALAVTSEDHREGVSAFLQKRVPVFRGR